MNNKATVMREMEEWMKDREKRGQSANASFGGVQLMTVEQRQQLALARYELLVRRGKAWGKRAVTTKRKK